MTTTKSLSELYSILSISNSELYCALELKELQLNKACGRNANNSTIYHGGHQVCPATETQQCSRGLMVCFQHWGTLRVGPYYKTLENRSHTSMWPRPRKCMPYLGQRSRFAASNSMPERKDCSTAVRSGADRTGRRIPTNDLTVCHSLQSVPLQGSSLITR